MGNIIEGVGADAEVITNAQGGKQSKSPAALHLVDSSFLMSSIQNYYSYSNRFVNDDLYNAFEAICCYMSNTIMVSQLASAIKHLAQDELQAILTIGKVLQYGAERYAPNNWRLIPREEHLNHALIHLVALLAGDTQDDHKEHAMCRLMMAIATQETKGFSYTEPFKDEIQPTK